MIYKILDRVKKDYFLYAVLLFLVSYFVLPTSKMVNNIYYIFVAIPAFFIIINNRFRNLKINYITILWIVLMLALFWSGIQGNASPQYYKHLVYLLLFFLVCVFLIKDNLFFTDCFYRISFWFVSLYVLFSAIFYWITGKYSFGEQVLWLPGRLSGPIYTSILISAVFSISLPVWLKQKKYFELFAALALSLFCMSFILQSRTGLVSMISVIFCYCIYMFYIKKGAVYVVLFSVFSFIAVGFIYIFSENIPIVDQLIKRADSGRFELWKLILEDFKSCSYLFGCGPGFKSDKLIQGIYEIAHPHNIFLALLVKTGFLSLLAFLIVCFSAIYLSYINKINWGLFLFSSMIALNFDGSHIVGNPDELWILILFPIFMIMLKSVRLREI